jgi:hypothetical protein
MSSVTAAPELISTAATDLANIGSNLSAAHKAAAASTVTVLPAAADEVSAGIADLFSQHAQGYQALAGKAVAFQQQFAQHLTASAGSYASAEAANAAVLQPLNAVASSVASDMQGQNEMDNFFFFLLFPIFKFFDELPQELALLIALLLLA